MSDLRKGIYLDASALVKLVVTEPESDALRRYLADDWMRISSRIAGVELRRVVRRQRDRRAHDQVESLLDGLHLVEVDERISLAAGVVGPPALRTLDAIHLASAQSVAAELSAVISYDLRLADAARAAGLTVIAPA